jgi:Rhamnan synthesis protein F
MLRRPFTRIAFHTSGRPGGWLRRSSSAPHRQGGAPQWEDFFDADWYAEHYDDVPASGLTPIQHFLRQGAAEFRDPNPAFDTDWYLRAYPDVSAKGVVPIEHFVGWGAAEGKLPFRGFDSYSRSIGFAHDSNLEAYRHYLAQRPQPGIPRKVWGAVADAEIRCLKEPSFDGELALFATYSSDGLLKSHVLHYVESLRREGIAVILIVNTDMASMFRNDDLSRRVDGLYVRQAKGYDFAAWAHVLQLRREILEAKNLYLINDSLFGPIDRTKFSELIQRIRTSKADVIGLTENLQRGWHLQSFFLVFKHHVLVSAAFVGFMDAVVCYEDKLDVIGEYEIRLATVFKRAGFLCEPMFRAIDTSNLTSNHWKELIGAGFPFLKVELLRNDVPRVDAIDCLKLLATMDFNIRLLQSSLAGTKSSKPPA